jgi:hypothetical protein
MSENPFVQFVARYGNDWVALVREVLGGDPDADQEFVIRAACRGERRVASRSGHGVGKTTGLAWVNVCQALTRFPQKTICTAPTSSQLFDALAAETKAQFKRLPTALQELFEIQVDQIKLRAAPEESFIAFRTSKAETPESMAGVHSAHVLLICDEASGIPEAVFEAAAGSMSGEHATTILAGNPVRTSGLFFDAFHKLRDQWLTRHISCVGHPRCSADFIEDMKRRYGVDSNAFRVRVLGEFPTSEDDVVIPFELMEASLYRDVKPLLVRPVWGLDVAYTGNDRSALAKRQGNVLMEKVKTWKGLDTMQLSGTILQEWRDTPPSERPDEILVDAIGFGAGVADRLRELELPARGINVAELPSLKALYSNLKTELYFLAREWFASRDCNLCGDEQLGGELTAIHYDPPTSSGKVGVEKSADTRKFLGCSPDLASAFVLTFASSASTALHGVKNSTTWNKPILRRIAGIV